MTSPSSSPVPPTRRPPVLSPEKSPLTPRTGSPRRRLRSAAHRELNAFSSALFRLYQAADTRNFVAHLAATLTQLFAQSRLPGRPCVRRPQPLVGPENRDGLPAHPPRTRRVSAPPESGEVADRALRVAEILCTGLPGPCLTTRAGRELTAQVLEKAAATLPSEEKALVYLLGPHIVQAYLTSQPPAGDAAPEVRPSALGSLPGAPAGRPAAPAGAAGLPPGASHLTEREKEVLHWLAEGKRDREIAQILGISDRTVEKHVEHVLHKLQVETRTLAVRLALETRV